MRYAVTMNKAVYEAMSQISREPGKTDESRDFVRRIFAKHVPRGLPQALSTDLFDWVWDETFNHGRKEFAGDVLDLFNMDYDDAAKPLTREDWDSLNDLIAEYDQDLDLQLLEYIMVRVVENGVFHQG